MTNTATFQAPAHLAGARWGIPFAAGIVAVAAIMLVMLLYPYL